MQYRILFIIFTSLLNIPVSADIVLDGTFGHSGSLQGPHFAIGAELGQQHGGNIGVRGFINKLKIKVIN
jgi:hypothetical protein